MSLLQIAAVFIIPLLVTSPFVDAGPSDLSEITKPYVAASGIKELFPLQNYIGGSGTGGKGTRLSSGQIAGIVIGSVAALAVILAVVGVLLRNHRQNTQKNLHTDAESGDVPTLQYRAKEGFPSGEAPTVCNIAPSTMDEDAASGTSHAHSGSHV